jgi:hypothetical protein
MTAALYSKPSKYRNRAVVIDGMRFASQSEAARWSELVLLQRAGQISDLKRQVVFACEVNGELVTKYLADFVYTRDGQRVVEDRKGGPETALFRMKSKLLHACHQIDIEITRARR